MHSTRGVVEPQPSVCRCCITALIHAAQTAGSAGSNGASPTNRCHALKCRGATTVSTGTPRSSSADSSATKPPFSASSAPNRLQTTRSGCRSIASRRTWLARANPCGSALQAVDPAARDCDTMYSTPVSMSVNTVSVRHPAAGSRRAISRPAPSVLGAAAAPRRLGAGHRHRCVSRARSQQPAQICRIRVRGSSGCGVRVYRPAHGGITPAGARSVQFILSLRCRAGSAPERPSHRLRAT